MGENIEAEVEQILDSIKLEPNPDPTDFATYKWYVATATPLITCSVLLATMAWQRFTTWMAGPEGLKNTTPNFIVDFKIDRFTYNGTNLDETSFNTCAIQGLIYKNDYKAVYNALVTVLGELNAHKDITIDAVSDCIWLFETRPSSKLEDIVQALLMYLQIRFELPLHNTANATIHTHFKTLTEAYHSMIQVDLVDLYVDCFERAVPLHAFCWKLVNLLVSERLVTTSTKTAMQQKFDSTISTIYRKTVTNMFQTTDLIHQITPFSEVPLLIQRYNAMIDIPVGTSKKQD